MKINRLPYDSDKKVVKQKPKKKPVVKKKK